MAAKFKMAAILPKIVYCYVHLSYVFFLNDFHYLCVFDSIKITKNLHLIHVLKSKMAPNFKMAAILHYKGMSLCEYILLLCFSHDFHYLRLLDLTETTKNLIWPVFSNPRWPLNPKWPPFPLKIVCCYGQLYSFRVTYTFCVRKSRKWFQTY